MNVGEKRINIKVTVEQYELLVKLAKMHGKTLSNYVREKLGIPLEQKGRRKDLGRGD